jgi:hypothetical protein
VRLGVCRFYKIFLFQEFSFRLTTHQFVQEQRQAHSCIAEAADDIELECKLLNQCQDVYNEKENLIGTNEILLAKYHDDTNKLDKLYYFKHFKAYPA